MRIRNTRTNITASQAVISKSKYYRVLPDYYYKEPENYVTFWLALIHFARSSRTLPDDLTKCMSEVFYAGKINCLFIGHWHQIAPNDDGRSIRNMLKADVCGQQPKLKSRNYDLLRYTCICLQHQNETYRQYVANWCQHQELCLGEEERDLF